jgi:hypothetical protein
MKLRFQRTKDQVNRRFLQADIAKLPKVARSEIFINIPPSHKDCSYSSQNLSRKDCLYNLH